MKKFEKWSDIRDWATENGYPLLAKRFQLNNDCWQSSGEFGRSQVALCDYMRFAETEEERHGIAESLEKQLADDDLLQCIKGKGENL